MTKITENTIEEFTIELLERLGYQHIYAPDMAPDGETLTQRKAIKEVAVSLFPLKGTFSAIANSLQS